MSASGSSSTAQRSKQSDNYNKQPKADKRKKVEEEQETHEQQEDGDSSAAQRKKSKQRVKEESKEAEHEEEEAAEEHEEEGDGEKSHEDAPSKPKLVVKKTSEGDEYIDLSYKRRIAVRQFRGSLLVDIRETYEKFGEMQPGKTGIALNLEQWEKLKASVQEIDKMIARSK